MKRRSEIKVPTAYESRKDTKPSGGHRLNGVLVASGKYFKRNYKIQKAHIMDMAPTILYLMGCPIDRDMDGKVIEEMLTGEFLENNEIVYQGYDSEDQATERQLKTYDREERKIIEENLKGLGYL